MSAEKSVTRKDNIAAAVSDFLVRPGTKREQNASCSPEAEMLRKIGWRDNVIIIVAGNVLRCLVGNIYSCIENIKNVYYCRGVVVKIDHKSEAFTVICKETQKFTLSS